MRLHRDDQGPDVDEPDDGWVEATGEAPSGPLGDVLTTWSVVRCWRDVQARTVTEAIAASRPEVEVGEDGYQVVMNHSHVRASRQPMAMLYLTGSELTVLLSAVGAALSQAEANLQVARSEAVQSALRHQLVDLNSLRTAVAEARYDTMSPEEREAEAAAYRQARDEGVIL